MFLINELFIIYIILNILILLTNEIKIEKKEIKEYSKSNNILNHRRVKYIRKKHDIKF